MKLILALVFLTLALYGCENIPIKDGALALDKDTTAGVEDMGVGKISRQF